MSRGALYDTVYDRFGRSISRWNRLCWRQAAQITQSGSGLVAGIYQQVCVTPGLQDVASGQKQGHETSIHEPLKTLPTKSTPISLVRFR